MKCEICGKESKSLKGGFGILMHCDREECITKTNEMNEEYKKQIEEKMSKPIEITDIETYADLERMMFAIAGKIQQHAEIDGTDLGISNVPQLLVQQLNEMFIDNLPTEYYKEERLKGRMRTADAEFWFVKKVPVEVVKETFVKSGILEA